MASCLAARRPCCAGVRNIQRASDVAGVYAAAGAGIAVGAGVRAIVLTNQNGAVLELSQAGKWADGERRSERARGADEEMSRWAEPGCQRPRN